MVPDISIVEKTNAVLPQQIGVMTMKRVTRGFSSKDACNARTYEYLMPTYAFAPFRLSTLDYRIDGRPQTNSVLATATLQVFGPTFKAQCMSSILFV